MSCKKQTISEVEVILTGLWGWRVEHEVLDNGTYEYRLVAL